ncbi:MAG: glycosyltransferase family 4 protein [bacterium]
MKIVVTVHQFLPESLAGTELIALGIAKELQRRGHEVTVVAGYPEHQPRPDAQRFDRYVYEGLRVERFRHSFHPMGDQRVLAELSYDNRLFARAFDAVLAETQPDVVHFIHLARLSASLVEPCVQRGVPTVFTATDFWPVCAYSQLRLPGNGECAGPDALALNCVRHFAANRAARTMSIQGMAARAPDWMLALGVRAASSRSLPIAPGFAAEVRALSARQPFLRQQLNRIDRILAPSRIMARKLVDGGVAPHRIELLPYGINLEGATRDIPRGSTQALRVGYIGSFAEHKGVEVAVNAVRRLLLTPRVELSISGAPGQTDACQAYYQRVLTLARGDARIRVLGAFPNSEVQQRLASLDVLVVPSLWRENTPLVVYEAFAAGCPVIASDADGISEVVQHDVNGLLFPTGDEGALAACISRLAADRTLLQRLAAGTQPPLSLPEHVSRLEEIYRELIVARVATRQPQRPM